MDQKKCNLICYFDNAKLLINKNLHLFLFTLIKYIILSKDNSSKNFKLKTLLKKLIKLVNEKIIVKKENEISFEYSKENFNNILNFVKTQNKQQAGEIIENILIIVFSYGFKIKKQNTFGKYLYNNIDILRDEKKINDFTVWFKKEKFRQDELKNIETLLEQDISIQQKDKTQIQKEKIIYNLLSEIYNEKYFNENKHNLKNKHKSFIYNIKITEEQNLSDTAQLDNYVTASQYTNINSCMYEKDEKGKMKKTSINIMRSFFISVYIYYQNKHSPLMKYIEEIEDKENHNNKLAGIPFVYDLTGACIQNTSAGIIMAPCRIEPRINKIVMTQNILKGNGFLELSKVLLFNNKIKNINYHLAGIKSKHISFLSNGLGLFDIYNIEEIDISNCYLKEDCKEMLSKLLSHLKGLKTINISNNPFKSGISSFLIILKNLYRKNKISLETLNLRNCILDDISFYELGELLKSKSCKLKALYLNNNNIPSSINFLKKLKKNKSLTKIYFNESNLGNNDSDNVMRLISCTNIGQLYLYKNNFNDFNEALRILYRTKLIKAKEEKKVKNEIDLNKKEDKKEKDLDLLESSIFYNLDLSSNCCINKNENKIFLLKKGIAESTLRCFDFSNILNGNISFIIREELKDSKESKEYKESITNLKNILNNQKIKYQKIQKDINLKEVDKKKLNIKEKEEYLKLEDEIKKVINNENAKYPIFLMENAKRIIKEQKNIFDKNNILKKEDFKKIEKELINYMNWKKINEDLEELKKKAKFKKLILI